MEDCGIIKESAPTRPADELIKRILLLLKISTVFTTFWSALSIWMTEGLPVLLDPVLLFTEVSNFKQ